MQFGCILALMALCPAANWAAAAPKQIVTITLRFDHRESKVALEAMRADLSRVMQPIADLRFIDSVPPLSNVPSRLIAIRMLGSCTMDVADAHVLEAGEALAAAHVSNGVVLPFADVHCDRVRASVHRLVGPGDPQEHQYLLGMALARVISHELYHMLSGSLAHTRDGLSKSALAPAELISGVAALPATAATAIEEATELGGR